MNVYRAVVDGLIRIIRGVLTGDPRLSSEKLQAWLVDTTDALEDAKLQVAHLTLQDILALESEALDAYLDSTEADHGSMFMLTGNEDKLRRAVVLRMIVQDTLRKTE